MYEHSSKGYKSFAESIVMDIFNWFPILLQKFIHKFKYN